MYNIEFLPTPSSEIHQLSLTRLEGMRGLARSREPVELSRLDGLFTEFRGCIVEDDSGVGSCFDYVKPFVFSTVPVWDGRGVVWGDGYEMHSSLSKTTWIAEIELIPVDSVVQRVREGLGDEGGVSRPDPVCVRTGHRGWLVRWVWMWFDRGGGSRGYLPHRGLNSTRISVIIPG